MARAGTKQRSQHTRDACDATAQSVCPTFTRVSCQELRFPRTNLQSTSCACLLRSRWDAFQHQSVHGMQRGLGAATTSPWRYTHVEETKITTAHQFARAFVHILEFLLRNQQNTLPVKSIQVATTTMMALLVDPPPPTGSHSNLQLNTKR